jgi:ribosomal protein S27AE
MKLHEMKTKCRTCGKELIADDKDDDFVSFYCMKCGVYTTKPVEEFKDEPKPPPAAPAPEPPKQQ